MLIKIDTDKMQTVVNNLNDRAADLETARRNINNSSYLNHDPVPEVSEATELSSYATTGFSASNLTNLHACSQAITSLATDLATRRQEAINYSTSGGKFGDGTVGYYLPDPPEGTQDIDTYWQNTDTLANVKAYNSGAIAQAKADAESARNSQGQEALELASGSVHKNKDNPVYATVFSDTLGPQGMATYAYIIRQAWQDSQSPSARAGIEPQDRKEMQAQQFRLYTLAQSALSVTLDTATTSGLWNASHSKQYAKDLASLAVSEKAPVYGSLALNLLLSGTNHSVENSARLGDTPLRAGGVFHKDFLGTIESSIWLDEQKGDPHWKEQLTASLSHTPGTSYGDFDPYTGILTAMGRNPHAALDLLASPTSIYATENDIKIDESRYNWLMSRHWDQASLEGLTAAIAGVSTFRTPTSADPVKRATQPRTTLDERAAQLTELAVESLAGTGKHPLEDLDWDSASRRNLSVMFGNSMGDVDNCARVNRTGNKSGPFDASLPASWRDTHDAEVRKLLQEVSKDDSALAALGAAAGDFSRLRAEAVAADKSSADQAIATEKASIDHVLTAVKQNNQLAGFIMGAAQKARDLESDEHDASVGLFFDALSDGLKFVPSPQGRVAGQVYSILKDHLLEAGEDWATSRTTDTSLDDMGEALRAQNKITAFNALAQQPNMFGKNAFEDEDGHSYKFTWLNGRQIDPSQFKVGKTKASKEVFYENLHDLNDFLEDNNMPEWARDEIDFSSAFERGHDIGKGLE